MLKLIHISLRLQTLRDMLMRYLPFPQNMPTMAVENRPPANNHPTKYVDLNMLREVSGNDSKFVREVLADYLDNLIVVRTEIEQAAKRFDHRRISEIAHKLKSASLSIGAVQLGDISGKLESAGSSLSKQEFMKIVMVFFEILDLVRQELVTILEDELTGE